MFIQASLFALAVVAAIPVHAAEMSDADLVKLCQEELKSRQSAAEVQSNTELVGSKVERSERQVVVDIQVTEAEGRRVTGRCIVRNGKVFDFKG